MEHSYVVTGGGRGVGRAIAETIARQGGVVVVLESDPDALTWIGDLTPGSTIQAVIGDAANEDDARQAARIASSQAPLHGWINNAARFRDAFLDEGAPAEIRTLIDDHLMPAIFGSSVAVKQLLSENRGGSILNISSHQSVRPVPGCLPYATAKAAIEGLTRSVAVDYGGRSILGHDPEARPV